MSSRSFWSRLCHHVVLCCYLHLTLSYTWAHGTFSESADYTLKIKALYHPAADQDEPDVWQGWRLRLKQRGGEPGPQRDETTITLGMKPVELPLGVKLTTIGDQPVWLWTVPSLKTTLAINTWGHVVVDNLHNADTIRLDVPGSLLLSNSTLKGLQVKSRGLVIRDRVQVEQAAVHLSSQDNTIHVVPESTLSAESMVVSQGTVFNQGMLTAAGDQQLDLQGNALVNQGTLSSQGTTTLTNAGYMLNMGTITAPTLKLTATYLQNERDIGSDKLRIIAHKGVDNNGTIHSTQQTDIVSLNGLYNSGTIHSQGQQQLYVYRMLSNTGLIDAQVQQLMVWGTVANNGTFKADYLTVKAKHWLTDTASVITGIQQTTLEGGGTLAGTVTSPHLTLKARGQLTVQAALSADTQVWDGEPGSELLNHSTLTTNRLTTQGDGTIINHGHVTVRGDADINNQAFDNERTLKVTGKTTLAPRQRLTVGPKGLLHTGYATLTGAGDVTVGISVDDQHGFKVDHTVTVDKFTGAFSNFGHTLIRGYLTGQLHRVLNKGTLVTTFKDAHIVDGSNHGTMTGAGTLTVDTFTNAAMGTLHGRDAAQALTLTINTTFTNDGKLAHSALHGQGRLQNYGTMTALGTIALARVHNAERHATRGQIDSVLHTTAANHEFINDGVITVPQSLSLTGEHVTIKSAQFTNNGELQLRGHSRLAGARFDNNGLVITTANPLLQKMQISSSQFKNNGQFTVGSLTFEAKGAVANRGTIKAQHTITGTNLVSLSNSGLIESTQGSISLASDILSNSQKDAGIFKAYGHIDLATNKYSFNNYYIKALIAQTGKITMNMSGATVTLVEHLEAKLGSTLNTATLLINGNVQLHGTNAWTSVLGARLQGRKQQVVVHNLKLQAQTMDSGDTSNKMVMSGSSTLQATKKIHGQGAYQSSGDVTVITPNLAATHLQTQGNLTLDVDQLSVKDYTYVSEGTLSLKRPHQEFTNTGHLQGNTLDLNVKRLINTGTLIGSTTILNTQQGFANKRGAKADLGTLTWINKPQDQTSTTNAMATTLVNEGTLSIDKLDKLDGISRIENALGQQPISKKNLKDQQRVWDDGVLTIKNGGFHVTELINNGALVLGLGTYKFAIFENHKDGVFTPGQHNLTNSFTNDGRLSLMNSLQINDGRYIKRLGEVMVGGKLIFNLHEQADTTAILEKAHLSTGHGIEIYQTDCRIQRSLTFTTPVHFINTTLHNLSKLKAPLLDFTVKSFIQGQQNVYGELKAGQITINAEQVDNQWGQIFGQLYVKIKATKGDIKNGTATTGHPKYTTHGMNKAFISSDGTLEMEATQGNILNDYGSLYATGYMTLAALNTIRNKAGIIWGRTGGRFTAKSFDNIREVQRGVTTSWQEYRSSSTWYGGTRSWYDSKSRTDYTEQSDTARVEFTNEYGDGSLILDVLQASVIASLMNISGNLTARNISIDPSKPYPSFFKLEARHDTVRGESAPSVLTVRGNVAFDSSAVKISGNIDAVNIEINADNFFADNIDQQRQERVKKTLVFDLAKLAQQYVMQGGLFKDKGYDARGARYKLTSAVQQPPALNTQQMVVLGGAGQELSRAPMLLDPAFMQWCIRTIATQLCGTVGLEGQPYVDKLVKNAQDNKDHIKSYDDLYKMTQSMLVLQLQQLGKAYDQRHHAPSFVPHFVIAGDDQQDYENPSGRIAAQERVDIKGRNVTLQSALVEAEHINIQAQHKLKLARKKYSVVTAINNGYRVQEFAAPSMKLRGRKSIVAVGVKDYEATGITVVAGAEGAELGSTDGPAVTRPLTLHTDEYTTEKHDGGWLGTDTTKTTHHHSEQLKRSKIRSQGPITHRSGAQDNIQHTGVLSQSKTAITYTGGGLDTKAAVARHSTTESVDKSSTFKNSSSSTHSEGVGFRPNIAEAPIINYNIANAELRGSVMKGPRDTLTEVYDRTQTMKVGMHKETVNYSQHTDKSGIGGLGPFTADREHTVSQDMGCPSVILAKYWHSDKGQSLIFESVLGHKIKKFIVEKNFQTITTNLKRTETIHESASGFAVPGLGQPVHDPLVDAFKGFDGLDNKPDQLAGGLKLGSAATGALTDGFRLLNGENPLTTLLKRYVSVSMNFHQGSSHTEQSVAQSNELNCEVMIFNNDRTHLEGHITTDKLFVFAKTLTGAAMQDTYKHNADAQDVSLTWTYGSFIPAVGVNLNKHSIDQRQHHNTKIDANHVFVRVDDWLFSGVNLRAKIVDAVVKRQLTLESVLDWYKEESTNLAVNVGPTSIPDIRYASREKITTKINEWASLIGTEQFYLKVGQQLLTRSAEFGLQPDGASVQQWRTTSGQRYYVRPMPTHNNDGLFHALLTSQGVADPRTAITNKLTQAADRDDIRTLMAPEIKAALFDDQLEEMPEADVWIERHTAAKDAVYRMLNQAKNTLTIDDQGIQELLKADSQSLDPRLDALRQALVQLNTIDQQIEAWTQSADTYKAYVQTQLAVKGKALPWQREVNSELPSTGTLDAIAELYGLKLEVYGKAQSQQLIALHSYTPSLTTNNQAQPQTVCLVLSSIPGSRHSNHVDRLEETLQQVDAASIIREQLHEYEHKDDTTINLPMGTAYGFMGQLTDLQQMMAGTYTYLTDEKKLTTEEALNLINDKGMEKTIADRLHDLGATPEETQTVMNDPAIQSNILYGKTFIQVEALLDDPQYTASYQKSYMSNVQSALRVTEQMAIYVDDFAERHPTLIKYGFEALQLATGGPIAYLRNTVFTAVGINDFTDALIDQAQSKLENYLVTQCNFTPERASMGSEVGRFGLTFAASSLGAANKDKVLKSAKDVAQKSKFYMTYTKQHPSGTIYTGRTSSHGDKKNPDDIFDALRRRDANHHMNKEGYGKAKIDSVSTNSQSIRGKEQLGIDKHGGAQSKGGTSGNKINSISDKNPKKDQYIEAAKKEFGDS